MAVFKCKMCGGSLEISEGMKVCECEYCGTKQTLPRLDDDRRTNLYDRANHFRRNNDFDKAAGIYEQILNEDTSDSEAYWSLVLCRYGIEYVEDPATHKRVPTVNRAQFTSVFDDNNYKSALQYADGYQREIYEKEAKAINDIQKGILAISRKEEPFDVFICYKETDNNGRRTPDSVLANDLYHQLAQEGFKVFFARITLEDKLGTAYEPYIFAALNSSKVMVVLGTKPEYFNAVWVRNEWSRYLALVKQSGGKKVLIPAYKDMDPYDLPEEFSHLQAQDMSKLGFMQDLIRGIKKIAKTDESKAAVKETVVVGSSNANVAPLLERVFLFLEDGKWQDANIYCEKVLDLDPKNATAYLGKLMSEQQVRTRKQLADCAEPFDNSDNYAKVLRFGDEKLETEMRGYIVHINERNENTRLTNIYYSAVNAMNAAKSEEAFKAAAKTFRTIPGFRDADTLAEQCLEKAEICLNDAIYKSARFEMSKNMIGSYESAITKLGTISGWRDANEQINICQRKIEEIKAKEEAYRLEREHEEELRRIAAERSAKKRKKVIAITTLIVLVCIAFVIVLVTVIIPESKYSAAMSLYNEGKYDEAIAAFDAMDGYKDSDSKKKEIYDQQLKSAKVGDYVVFGSYEQDNNTSNGKEYVEWLVLAKEGDKALVISKYALDSQEYGSSVKSPTWETCTLRKWLNGTFISNAFSSVEQNMIQSTTVTADKNPSYSTFPGINTTDKIFLLSITEVDKYFSSDEARKCVPTEYAEAQGVRTSSSDSAGGKATCCWWLRSPGSVYYNAAYVDYDGSVNYSGNKIYHDDYGVRPALWINLGS